MNPSYAVYANLGSLYAIEKKWAEAADVAEKALALNSNDYLVWDNLAGYYKWLNQKDKLEQVRARMLPMVESRVASDPRDAMAQAVLANLYAEKGMKTQALTRIRSAEELSPDDPEVLQEVGDAAEKLGDRKAALGYINRALQKGATIDSLASDPDLQELVKDPGVKLPAKS